MAKRPRPVFIDGPTPRLTRGYEGLLVAPATTGAVGRQLQSALTKEVELVKHGKLVAELVKLHQHDRRRE
jgi:hypothetical protein